MPLCTRLCTVAQVSVREVQKRTAEEIRMDGLPKGVPLPPGMVRQGSKTRKGPPSPTSKESSMGKSKGSTIAMRAHRLMSLASFVEDDEPSEDRTIR